MQLTIVHPLTIETTLIVALEIQALSGNIVIQEGHAPALIVIQPHSHVNWTLANGTVIRQKVYQGIVEVNRSGATLIMDREI